MSQRKYDSTVARIAGNLLSGQTHRFGEEAYSQKYIEEMASDAVRLARAIVAEVERTEPAKAEGA